MGTAYLIIDTSTNYTVSYAAGTTYSGPVSYLQNQYFASGSDSLNIAATVANVYLCSSPTSTGNLLAAFGGSNVLDGENGSNFLVGTTSGADTFFTDARSSSPVWNTIVNFHSGDAVTMWGVSAATALETQANAGAAGFTGYTIHADTLGNGSYSAAITLAGVTSNEVTQTYGAVGGVSYLYLTFHSAAATYSLAHDSQSSVTEGGTETFTLSTTGVATGTTLYYSLAGVTAAEVANGQLTGSITVGSNGTATLPVTLTATAGEGLSGNLTATISTTAGGAAVATASEPLTETTALHASANPIASGTYSALNTSPGSTWLYGSSGTPQYLAVNQGEIGDCYFLSALADLAVQNPGAITSMIQYDGNGIYSVRFAVNGQADWITLNDQLPTGVNSSNGYGNWASLIEKAFAIQQGGSYSNIGNGGNPATALQDITGVSCSVTTTINTNTTNSMLTALAHGQEVSFGSSYLFVPINQPAGTTAVSGEAIQQNYNGGTVNEGIAYPFSSSDHEYSVLGYDSSTGEFIVANPWGGGGGQYGSASEFPYAVISKQLDVVDTGVELAYFSQLEMTAQDIIWYANNGVEISGAGTIFSSAGAVTSSSAAAGHHSAHAASTAHLIGIAPHAAIA